MRMLRNGEMNRREKKEGGMEERKDERRSDAQRKVGKKKYGC